MKRLAVLLLLLGAAPAQGAQLLVVGRGGEVLHGPHAVDARAQRVTVAGRRCTVGARTPLAALLDSRLTLRLRDYGSCGRRARDASGLYVRGVGRQKERGRNGWVYKAGNTTPSTGAGDLASRTRGRVLWFWCVNGRRGCQRTLDVTPAAETAAPGSVLEVEVRAYDDHGKSVPAEGAMVTIGSEVSAVADADGVAAVTLGPDTGTLKVVATQAKRVRSFAEEVSVG